MMMKRTWTEFEVAPGLIGLNKTFDCGQCFGWTEVGLNAYEGVVNRTFIHLEYLGYDRSKDKDIFKVNMPKESHTWLFRYLGLDDDYSPLFKTNLTTYERKAIKYGYGIRILRQPLWETIVSFIVSQRNNIPKIKSTLFKLRQAAGEKVLYTSPDGERFYYYTFPTASAIEKLGLEGLKKCGLGYRAEYVYEIARKFNRNNSMFERYTSDEVDSKTVTEFFQMFNGIGPKVSGCIALFGCHKLDVFPIDIWMQRVIDTQYNGRLDTSRFGNLAGVMQQYLFYYARQKQSND